MTRKREGRNIWGDHVLPTGDQQCFRMPRTETFEGGKYNVLAFAKLEFAAGEDHETITIQASARARAEQRSINALITKMYRSLQVPAVQQGLIPT